GCAPVDRMEAEGVDVVRKPARAADARDEGEVFARHAELGQHLLHLREDRVVPASGAPAHVLIGDEILPADGAHDAAASLSGSPSSLRARLVISETLKGRPCTFPYPTASTRYSARMIRTSWPRFISGTRT